jgi:uracil-DNA glycosylase
VLPRLLRGGIAKRQTKELEDFHFDACWVHLSRELQMVQPELVVCVGSYPWDQFNRQIGRPAPKLSSCVMSGPQLVEFAGQRFLLMAMFHPARWESWASRKTPGLEPYSQHLRGALAPVL